MSQILQADLGPDDVITFFTDDGMVRVPTTGAVDDPYRFIAEVARTSLRLHIEMPHDYASCVFALARQRQRRNA